MGSGLGQTPLQLIRLPPQRDSEGRSKVTAVESHSREKLLPGKIPDFAGFRSTLMRAS
jgi:hypothetical protein